jgi:aspartyl-tRNA(Asn)/glutamyl-tRNA(Gln) amidotransferase subunit C
MEKRELTVTAELAQIELREEETERLTKEVSQMVSYFEKMMEVSVEGLEPTTHAMLKKNRLRPDNNNTSDMADDILEQAPDLEDRFICIPNVL